MYDALAVAVAGVLHYAGDNSRYSPAASASPPNIPDFGAAPTAARRCVSGPRPARDRE